MGRNILTEMAMFEQRGATPSQIKGLTSYWLPRAKRERVRVPADLERRIAASTPRWQALHAARLAARSKKASGASEIPPLPPEVFPPPRPLSAAEADAAREIERAEAAAHWARRSRSRPSKTDFSPFYLNR